IFAVSGRSISGIFTHVVEAYDPLLNSWSTEASIPTNRYVPGYGVIGSSLYVVGSQNENGIMSTVEAFTPCTSSIPCDGSSLTIVAPSNISVNNDPGKCSAAVN